MAVLSLDEFTAGKINDVTSLTLFIPLDRTGDTMLVGGQEGSRVAVYLDGERRFKFVEQSAMDLGLIIGDARIEIDSKSLFDAQVSEIPYGALVRQDSSLYVVARKTDTDIEPYFIALVEDLDHMPSSRAIGFTGWRIEIGHEANRREYVSVQV